MKKERSFREDPLWKHALNFALIPVLVALAISDNLIQMVKRRKKKP